MSVAALADGLAGGRVVVVGSLPPAGRDLDLLVREAEAARLARGLREHGFSNHGVEWVRFRRCASVEALDLLPAAELLLAAEPEAALFELAHPLPGFDHLARPAPHHLLLLLARRRAARPGLPLPAKWRARIAAALEEDPEAWKGAEDAAPDWKLIAQLAELRRAAEQPPGPSAAVAPKSARHRGGRLRDLAWRARTLRWAPVVAFSGLDGSGKSSQAEALRETLEQLGMQPVIEWTRLEWTTLWDGASRLERVARPVKLLLRLVTGEPVDAARSVEYGERPADAAALVRQRSAAITHGWTFVVALAHAAAQRRALREHLRAGRVVICDRYTLDSAVHLRDRYGGQRRLRAQVALMHLLTPRPALAYLIDVPGDVAHERKPEQFGVQELRRQADLYREYAPLLGVRVLDGRRDRTELCVEIAAEAWATLRRAL